MGNESTFGALSKLSAGSLGVFRGCAAVDLGVTRKHIAALRAAGVIDRMHPDTYRMVAAPRSDEQALRAALLWAGDTAAAAGRSAGEAYGLERVRANRPEIVIVRPSRVRSSSVIVHEAQDRGPLMLRQHRGIRVTGVEPTLLALAAALEPEAFEIACEDARRRQLTSVPALRTYRYDFAFPRHHTILETNGRRWHDDTTDYERDNEKWSVPGRHGYRLVLATWDKINRRPAALLAELTTTLAA